MEEIKKAVMALCEKLGISVSNTAIQKSSADDLIEEKISIEVVYEPDVKDVHGNWMNSETIQKGCENFNSNLELGVVKPNLFHMANTDKFEIVKSWVHEEIDVTVDASGEPVKAGTWLAKIHYKDDNLWKLKKEGVIQGVSIFGYGNINEDTGEITNLTFDEKDDEE